MNKRIACSVFLLSLASTALADQTAPGVSILSYLSAQGHELSAAPGQLTMTPTQTYTVRAIQVTYYTASDGSCNDKGGACTIDNGVGNTVTLTSGHHYVTTDLSNFSLDSSCTGFTPTRGAIYQLQNNNLRPIPGTASNCISGAGGVCNNIDGIISCGWGSAQIWTPGAS